MHATRSQVPDPERDHTVLHGVHRDLTWHVRVEHREDGLLSMLDTFRDGKLVDGGGMGGPSLEDDRLVDYYRGVADGVPWSVLVRTHPSVISVAALTERGAQVLVPLSMVVPAYGLRFGAAYLADGDTPVGLLVETPDGVASEMGRLFPQSPSTGRGWQPY